MKQSRKLLVIITALVIGRFCFSAEREAKPSESSGGGAAISQLDYVLQPSDLVKVIIFQEPDLERDVRLSADSKISLPLINQVDLKGKTIEQAQKIIRDLYAADYLVNPQINLTVMEYNKETVNVLGAVNSPGPVAVPPDQPLNLLDAISRAGGFSRLANRRKVQITRESSDHKTTTVMINADDILQSTNQDQQRLQKGDLIYVPERIL